MMSTCSNTTAQPELFQDRKYLLGNLRLDAVTHDDLLKLYDDAITRQTTITVLHHNLHGIYVKQTTLGSDAIYDRADWVYVDGMPVIWLAKAAGFPFEAKHRTTFLDCFGKILDEAARKNWRIFYFGGKEEVLVTGLEKIRALRPSLQIAGCNGYYGADQSAGIIEDINKFKPDILFVGLGMPLQEQWIDDHLSKLRIPVVATSGATMEYISGHSYRPPAWAGKFGLYGVLRFLSRPTRLWRRYLLEPLVLAPYLVRLVVQQRRKNLHSSPLSS